MKKLLVLLGILAAFSLMGCPKDPKDPVNPPASDPIENEDTGDVTPPTTEDEGDKEPEVSVFDGNVDLTKLAEYDEAAGGLVKDFGKVVNSYETAFTFTVSDLGYTDEEFTKIEIIADIYNGDEKYDLGDSNYDAAKWNRRIMATNGTKQEYNMGVKGVYIPFTSATDEILIQIKGEPVTKVVITAINFVK